MNDFPKWLGYQRSVRKTDVMLASAASYRTGFAMVHHWLDIEYGDKNANSDMSRYRC